MFTPSIYPLDSEKIGIFKAPFSLTVTVSRAGSGINRSVRVEKRRSLGFILTPSPARGSPRQGSLGVSRIRAPSRVAGLGRRAVVALSDQAAWMSSSDRARARGSAR